MNKKFETLLNISKNLAGDKTVSDYVRCGHVACALLAKNQKIYTGISINAKCGIGFCAEHAAIADMLKDGESEIEMLVSSDINIPVVPCGRCLEFIRQINDNNVNTKVLLENDTVTTINELLPVRWDINKI